MKTKMYFVIFAIITAGLFFSVGKNAKTGVYAKNNESGWCTGCYVPESK